MRWQDENTPRGIFRNWHRRLRFAQRTEREQGIRCGIAVFGDSWGVFSQGVPVIDFSKGTLRAIKGACFGRAAAECIWRFNLDRPE